ncbi:MAG: hypothetical protein ACYC5H_04900 [Methylovirgula sp.]
MDALFNGLPVGGPRLLFKGFGLISRFSEDIDVTVFREDLRVNATVEDLRALSGTKRTVYQRLFEIAQRLLQSGGNESVELVWGIGLARWSRPEESIDLPMIERGVEIEIADESNAAITIRPRSTSARVELRPFEKLAAGRLTLAEDAARRCLHVIETADNEGVSPFRTETFEPVLKIMVIRLGKDADEFIRECV